MGDRSGRTLTTMELDEGVPGQFGNVFHIKKQRRKRQKLLISDLFLDFAKNTTLHGLRYITEVRLTVIEKVFWFITFVVSVILCFFLIAQVWHKWKYSPVIVSFNEMMIPVGEVPFPSITICPQWKCKASVFNYSDHLSKVLKRYGKDNNWTYDSYENMTMLEDAFLVCKRSGFILKNRTTSDESLVQNLMMMAPDVNDVILNCQWRGNSCHNSLKKVLTNEGVCFNFNALSYKDIFKEKSVQSEYKYLYADTPTNKWTIESGYTSPTINKRRKGRRNRIKKREVNTKVEEREVNTKVEEYPRRGQENGAQPDLVIVLTENPEDSDAACNSLSNGWKIYLQHPADMPQASLYYYAAISGQVSSLALKFSVLNTSDSLKNYSPEQRQCYFPKDRALKYFATYTPDNCRLECLSQLTYKKCKCVWYHMPHNNSSEICTAKKQKCIQNAYNELASNRLEMDKCNCLPSCESIHYDAEILKTNFDVQKYFKSAKKLNANPSLPENYGYARLDIYFKEPRFVSMRRSELFGLTDFLANCGGLLGLFLGFSFLSLVEMFYFVTLRLLCTLKKDIKIEKRQLKESMYKK